MNKLAVSILLVILLTSFMTATLNVKTARSASTIVVPDDCPTIQAAIGHASDGDTVFVKKGMYYEHMIYIGKSISLVGEAAEDTILDGNGTQYIIFGNGEPLCIENLTFQNAHCGVHFFPFSGMFSGNIVRNTSELGTILFSVNGGATVLIENNTFLQNNFGLELVANGEVTIRKNIFIDNKFGLGLSPLKLLNMTLDQSNTVDGYPVYYFEGLENQMIDENTCPLPGYLAVVSSDNITIRNLKMQGKNCEGLMLFGLTNFTVANVTSNGNFVGISLISCSNGTINNSTMKGNSEGVDFYDSSYLNFSGNVFESDSHCFDAYDRSGPEKMLTIDIDTSNSADGGIVYYLKNLNDTVLDDTNVPNAGFLGLVNSSNVTVKDLNDITGLSLLAVHSSYVTITNVSASSLQLYFMNFSDVSNDRFKGKQEYSISGVEGFEVHDSILEGNYVTNFWVGFRMIGDRSFAIGNTIENCDYAIDQGIWSSVLHNNFIDNRQSPPYIVSSGTLWDNGYPSGGNYWSDEVKTDLYQGPYQNETGSDGIADFPYAVCIAMDRGNCVDHYPLAGPWTATGENITVNPSSTVTVTFDNITSEGITVVTTNNSGPDPPLGFKLESASPEYYEINTTSNYEGPITIGISYNDSGMTLEEENELRLMHWNAPDSTWTDITTSIDTTNNVVYGEAAHLSTFIVGVWNAPSVDMRVVKVDSKSVVGRGYVLSANLTVENQGSLETTFNVTLYANGSFVDATSEIDWQGGIAAPIYLFWNTSGVAYGNYTLKASIPPCVNETDVFDNNCTCNSPVHVGVPGDVSSSTPGVYDGVTNMKDIAYLVSLFNTRPSSSNWNPNADVNNDCVCNMRDIAIAVHYFNQHE